MDPKSRWILVLTIIVIILVIAVIYIHKEVSDCCDDQKPSGEVVTPAPVTPAPNPNPGANSGPGPGPIIVIQPTGGSPKTASWSMNSTTVTTWGRTGELHQGAFGTIQQFYATVAPNTPGCAGTTCMLESWQLTIKKASTNEYHSIRVERTTSNQLAWSVDGLPLTACDDVPNSGPPDCQNSGLPPEFNGTIHFASVTPSATNGPAPPVSAISSATMWASQ